MDNNFRFKLSNKPKGDCPSCGAKKRFCHYVDTATGLAVDAAVCGKCDRVYNCGYHLPPGEYFKEVRQRQGHIRRPLRPVRRPGVTVPVPPPVDAAMVSATMERDPAVMNPLYRYFEGLFGVFGGREGVVGRVVAEEFGRYGAGTSTAWGGSAVFWLYDSECGPGPKVVDGKIMAFDAATGKRVKEPFPKITFVSKRLSARDGKDYQTLFKPMFGEHLLAGRTERGAGRRVVVVESEKTAVALAVLSRFMPVFGGGDTVFVAVQSVNGFTGRNVAVLRRFLSKSRHNTLVLCPDAGCEELWSRVAAERFALFAATGQVGLYDTSSRLFVDAGADALDYVEDAFRRGVSLRSVRERFEWPRPAKDAPLLS